MTTVSESLPQTIDVIPFISIFPLAFNLFFSCQGKSLSQFWINLFRVVFELWKPNAAENAQKLQAKDQAEAYPGDHFARQVSIEEVSASPELAMQQAAYIVLEKMIGIRCM